jgi:plasmid stabilization system protein ParE
MRVIFRAEAAADLRSIIAYYEEVAPEALANILSDIYRSIDQLTRFPRIGMPVADRPFRRLVTLKYHFKVAYEVHGDLILILGIFRHQDREI